MVQDFDPNTQETKAGGFLSSMSTWPTMPVQIQLELHKDTESQQTNENKQKEGP